MIVSASATLLEKHGITARPGQKGKCPFCHHKTFAIKRDDTLGKCFHPACGRFLTPFQSDPKHGNVLSRILETIYQDFHKHFLDLRRSPAPNAYAYCVKERGIHPQVVADSMLGAVLHGYDLNALFDPHLRELEVTLKAEEAEKKGRGRPSKSPDPSPREQIDFLAEAREKLSNCIRGCTGWLAFFYTDAAHRIVSIRFREPYSKRIMFFKPGKIGGVFNHGLFTPFASPDLAQLNECLFVVEGEFNQLQLQSLGVRVAEAKGLPPENGYLFACAIGGVHNADLQTIRCLALKPILCYDNDANGAGFAFVEKATQTMSVTAFTTPAPDTDLDDFIRSFGADYQAAWEAVKSLVAQRKPHYRSHESLAAQVFAVRQRRKGDLRREFEICAEVAEIVRADLQDQGRFYHTGWAAYFFFEEEKRLIEITADGMELTIMLTRYGINRSEAIFRYLLEDLRTTAFTQGTRTEVHRLAYYDPEGFILYLFNHENQIYRVTPEAIELVDNGTDGVLFLQDPRHEVFQIQTPDPSHCWLDKIILSQINFAEDRLTPDERKLILFLWLLSLFFEAIFPTKPILALIGPKGSGKTHIARKIGKLLFGSKFDVTSLTDDPKDFDAAVTNSALVSLDNVDSKSAWLNDRLATVATGGVIQKRELYTTNRLVEIVARCFLVLTSRTPHFRRDDVADRLLIMRLERFPHFRSEKALLQEVIENRSRILSEVVHYLQEVVRALREAREVSESAAFRMADFADFSIKVTRYAGIEEKVTSIFQKLTHEQSSFALENEPVFELLCLWVEKNAGREITYGDLYQELARLAEEHAIPFPYKGKSRSFSQRMANLQSNLEEFFVIGSRPIGGHKKLYSFTPKRPEEG